MRLGVLWILFSALSLPPPSELHHTKEVDSRQYKEDWGGGGGGGRVRRAGGDEIFCVLMQFLMRALIAFA